MERLLSLRQVEIGYGRVRVAGPFDLELRRGELLLVAGPNGAGKSTLIETMLGTVPPLSGSREAVGLGFGYVPQREGLDLIWPFTALEVAQMGLVPSLRPFERLGTARRDRAKALLSLVGMDGLYERPFRELSGGQQQRALVARALCAEPDVLILDEPTNHLDVPGERAVFELLAELAARPGAAAMVVVTHRLEPLLDRASKMALLRKGRVHVGVPAELLEAGLLDDLLTTPPPMRKAAP